MTSVNATDGGMTADEATAYLGYRTRAVLDQAVRRGIAPAHRLGASAFASVAASSTPSFAIHPSVADPASRHEWTRTDGIGRWDGTDTGARRASAAGVAAAPCRAGIVRAGQVLPRLLGDAG